jgi:hypothetical protein
MRSNQSISLRVIEQERWMRIATAAAVELIAKEQELIN